MPDIRSYSTLSSQEQQHLLQFFEACKGQTLPKVARENHLYLTAAALGGGEYYFSIWKDGHPLSSLGLIQAEIARKREIYLVGAALQDTADSTAAFAQLVAHCNHLATATCNSPLKSRLGIGPRLSYAANTVSALGYDLHETMLHLTLCDTGALTPSPGKALQESPLSKENMAHYLELHNSAFAHVPNGALTTAEELCQWLTDSPRAEHRALLTENGRPVAFYEVSTHGRTGMIDAIGVAPVLQGSGYGACALGAAIARLKTEGAAEIDLLVMDSNTSALALYRKAGFADKDFYNRWYQKMI